MEDKRVVTGVGCCWWDDISKVSINTVGLPCCPFCNSVLFEFETEEKFFNGAVEYEKNGHPNYVEQLKWMKGKHFKSMKEAEESFIKYKKNK